MATRQEIDIDRELAFKKWLSGIPYEVAFWRSYYGNKRRRRDLFSWSLYGKQCRLDGFDIDAYFRDIDCKNPRILDVGCALSYAFGNIIDGKEREITYVDPLAPFYNRILRRYKIDRPAITYGMIESLTGAFGRNTADFIHVRNALDHCADPVAGIIQCLATLKLSRVLYLNHFVNEAEGEGYRGFHQFNITEEQGNLIIRNRKRKFNVTELLKNVATVKTEIFEVEGRQRVVAVITKIAELPVEMFNPEEVTRRVANELIATVEYFQGFRQSAAYQWRRLYSTIGHKTMRLLPFGLLNRIKRLAGN